MQSLYYNRQGDPIDSEEFAKLFSDPNYRVLKQTALSNGKLVSTVWLGIKHQFGDDQPLIFETMVFQERGNYLDDDCRRHSTEAEAIVGHEEMCHLHSGNVFTQALKRLIRRVRE